MNDTLLSSIISGAIGIIGALLGAIVGGRYSAKASMEATERSIDAQNSVIRKAKELEGQNKREAIQDSIKMIYLDFDAAIWESWLTVKSMRPEKSNISMIPMNTQYAKSVSLISDVFSIEELVLINKIYGMIEKIRTDIFSHDYSPTTNNNIQSSSGIFLLVIYGSSEKYAELHQYRPEMFTKDFALDQLHKEYKLLFNRLKEKSGLN